MLKRFFFGLPPPPPPGDNIKEDKKSGYS